MNDTLFYWIVEGLGKGVVRLGICVVLTRWGWLRGWRIWRTGWLVLGGMTLLSLAPAMWHWTWAEPTRRVLETVEASLAPVVGVEANEADASEGTVAGAGSAAVPAGSSRPIWTARQWLVAVWLSGVLATGGWLAWGFGVAARWRRQAVAVADPVWLEILRDEAAALGVARLPVLAVHPGAPGPCLVGVGRRPTLVLPAGYREWDAETRRAVVRHELAHMVGRDGPFAVFRSLVLALHWPNPLAWVAAARDRREQELAADRHVLASGMDAGAYASLLLRLARHAPAGPRPASCHSMASLSTLEGRFRAILGKDRQPTAPRRWSRAVSRFAALGVTVGAGCSSYRSPSSDPSALRGPGTPRVPVMDGDLQAYLKAAPSDAEMVTLKFRLIDADGQKVRGWNHSVSAIWTESAGVYPITVRRSKNRLIPPAAGPASNKEFIYPTAFNFPEIKGVSVDERLPRLPQQPMVFEDTTDHPDMFPFPVTPTTPTAFATKTIGHAIDNITVEPKAAFLLVQGRFVETLFDGFVDGAGEAFSPIMAPATTALGRPTSVMLTENQVKQPTFTTRETPFVVSALPGKAYRVRLNTKQPGWFLEVSAVPQKP